MLNTIHAISFTAVDFVTTVVKALYITAFNALFSFFTGEDIYNTDDPAKSRHQVAFGLAVAVLLVAGFIYFRFYWMGDDRELFALVNQYRQ